MGLDRLHQEDDTAADHDQARADGKGPGSLVKWLHWPGVRRRVDQRRP